MSTQHIVTMTAGEWHGLKDGRPEPLDLRDVLCWALSAFYAAEGLPTRCADETLHAHRTGRQPLSRAQRLFLEAYCKAWEAAEDCEAVHAPRGWNTMERDS